MIAEVDGFRSVASPIKLSRTPASYRIRPQDIGQSTLDVLREAGLTDAQIAHLQKNDVIRQSGEEHAKTAG